MSQAPETAASGDDNGGDLQCNEVLEGAPYREAAPGPRVPILGPEFFEAAEGSCDDDRSLSRMLLLDPTAPLQGLSP